MQHNRIKARIKSKNNIAAQTTSSISTEQVQAKIAQKAYEIYERRGCIHGYAEDDWFQAQQMVYAELGILDQQPL